MVVAAVCVFGLQVSLAVFPLLIVATKVSALLKNKDSFIVTSCDSSFRKSFGCGTKKDGDREAYQVIKDEYKKLGRMSFAEGCVLVIFTLLVLLWFTREPGFIPGWATVLFNQDKP